MTNLNMVTKVYNLIGYIHDDVVKSLCSMLPQMSVYIQFTDKGGKNVLYN